MNIYIFAKLEILLTKRHKGLCHPFTKKAMRQKGPIHSPTIEKVQTNLEIGQ